MVASLQYVGVGEMSGTVTKIVDCVRNGEVIASYRLGYGITLGPSTPPDLIGEAKENLINQGLIKPPFDFEGIKFRIRDDR
jgi:hypothetical protein